MEDLRLLLCVLNSGMGTVLRLGTGLFLIGALLLLSGSTQAQDHPAPSTPSGSTLADQARYMVQQLEYFSERYLARVAGRDTGLPPEVNGHDEFAARWTQEILANLHGLPVGVFRQSFATPGFHRLPAKRPGVNIVVAVPGSRHPDRAIIVGSHYDGEPTSKGSAYDDTSGCMIMLGLARALGDLWRSQGLPSLTVEFALFDAEEQGLIGSTAFTYASRHGALMPRPALMIDEEQSGAGYPARPFGLLANDPMPGFAVTARVKPHGQSQSNGPPTPANQSTLLRRLNAARSAAFAELHSVYPSIPYRGGNAPAFTPSDERYLTLGPVPVCCSDDDPFDAIGVPTATLSGDFTFYQHRYDWGFPFDQPQDTLPLLACDTNGAPQPGSALEAALALPLALSLQLIQAYAPPLGSAATVAVQPHSHPVAVFSTMPGANAIVRFQAIGVTAARWSFGDGATATGSLVAHTYSHSGTYLVSVHGGSASGSWKLVVPKRQPVFRSRTRGVNPPPLIPWHPAELQTIPGCR